MFHFNIHITSALKSKVSATFVIAAIAILSSFRTDAINVESTPGNLHGLIQNPSEETKLVVSGTIDARDLLFIASEMTELQRLDMSNVAISAYYGDAICGSNNHREATIPNGVFAGSKLREVILPANGTLEIGELSFASSQLESLSIAANVSRIGMGAFCACPKLQRVEFNGNCTLGSHMFTDCQALTEVSINGIEQLPESTFAGCQSLTTVNGGESLKTIGRRTFADCQSLSTFTFSPNLQAIGEEAFTVSGLTQADMSPCSQLSDIGKWCFAHCESLASVKLPPSLKHIGSGLLFDCTLLTEMPIPASNETIDDYSLKGLSSVSNITLPSTTTYIGDYAMSGMTGLTAIDASTLTSIPPLGREVWDAVAQQEVTLKVAEEMVEPFSTTAQWQEFNIVASLSGEESPSTELSDSSITGYLEGDMLHIESKGAPIIEVCLYDTSGRLLTAGRSNADEAVDHVAIDTSTISTRLLIAEAILSDGTRGALKIIR